MRYRMLLLTITLLFTIMAAVVPHVNARPESGRLKNVDAYIQETMRRLPIRGLSVAIVKGGEILYLQGYGTANTAGDPVTPQTPFMLASVTKTFTALAVRQLAADDRLNLDDSLQTYIPEFKLADANAAATTTIRDLLEHTSGISTLEGTQPYLHSPDTTFAQAIDSLARYQPEASPGAAYEYSNWNYVLLGEVVARASGQPYSEYMQTHILNPLEMRQASFADYRTLPGAATGNLIVFGARIPYEEKHIPIMLSAGYLTASAEDMARYLIPFFNEGCYGDLTLLPVKGEGWFDAIWQWHSGYPRDVGYGYAGGHNSINTAIELFPRYEVGVAVLMNTRLDALLPGPTASEIAFNIARLVSGFSYEVPSNQGFYGRYALLDALLLILYGAIGWQAIQLRRGKLHFRIATMRTKIGFWMGIAFNLVISLGILALPQLFETGWKFMLYHRPETSIPILAVSLCLGILSVVKVVRAAIQPETQGSLPENRIAGSTFNL